MSVIRFTPGTSLAESPMFSVPLRHQPPLPVVPHRLDLQPQVPGKVQEVQSLGHPGQGATEPSGKVCPAQSFQFHGESSFLIVWTFLPKDRLETPCPTRVRAT